MRVHLERLVELEYLAIRHGCLGSAFVYEILFDMDAPEAVAHIGLIEVEKLCAFGKSADMIFGPPVVFAAKSNRATATTMKNKVNGSELTNGVFRHP